MKYVLLLLVIPIYAMAEYELFHKSDTNQETFIDPLTIRTPYEGNVRKVFVYHNNISTQVSVEIYYTADCDGFTLSHESKTTYQDLNLKGRPMVTYKHESITPIPNTMQFQLVDYLCTK